MRSPREKETPPVHMRIYVYDGDPPPHGTPTAISLCPAGRLAQEPGTDTTAEVTCVRCNDHINAYGLNWA